MTCPQHFAAIDDVLFKLQDKPLRQLLTLVPSLINLCDISEEYDDEFSDEIKQEIGLSRQLLRGSAGSLIEQILITECILVVRGGRWGRRLPNSWTMVVGCLGGSYGCLLE